MIYPTIAELANVIKCLKKYIDDDCIDEDDNLPSIGITIGYSVDGTWDCQSGDNSFSGGAYGHHHWAVETIYRRSNSRTLARNLIEQLKELTWDCN